MEIEELKLLALRIRVVLEEIMNIREVIISRRFLTFRGDFSIPVKNAFSWMKERLHHMNYAPVLTRYLNIYEVRVLPEVHPTPSNPLINVALFILTLGSTLFVGAQMAGVNIIAQPHRIGSGIPFACSILSILVVHEFGHYTMSRYHGVKATLPYFIPAPTIIGTFGAIIKTKSYIPDKKSLLDIGAAGPICGFITAVVALIVGLSRSEVVDLKPLTGGGALEFGDSLIVVFMTYLIKGPLPEGKTVLIDPIGFAGWVGLLITAFNLMPIGQLDGGHILYALIGRWHSLVAKLSIGGLLVMGFLWQGWYIWAFLVLILGYNHAPPMDDVTPLNPGRRTIALAAILIFVVCLVPEPIKLGF